MTRTRPGTISSPLKGRVCLITGGAAGIGWALTRALAVAGAHVHVCDNSKPNLDRAATDLAGGDAPASVTFSEVDVCDRTALEEWITTACSERGRIDVLIHNAAYVNWTDVEEMTVEQAQLSMRTGYDALVCSVKTVLPWMRSGGGGQIVAMGSAAGRIFVKGPSASYAAVKAAIEAYTEMLRIELAGSGIDVTLVRPGTVAGTDFWLHVPSERMPRIADFLPPTSPEKVAAAVIEAIGRRRPAVDIPGYLPAFHRVYTMVPGLIRKAAAIGGNSRRDYALASPSRHAAPIQPAASPNGTANADSIALRALKKAGHNARFVRAMSVIAPGIDRTAHRLTGGRKLLMPLMLPSLMLTTTGRVSGRPHQVPLLCHHEADGSLLVVDSNFGRPHHPAWSHNLLATPHAAVTRGGRTFTATASLLEGPDRSHAWDHLVEVWPPYESFAQRSGRHLRIFRLTRSDRPRLSSPQ
ncbi:SDR family NAD(P)-dependent oxidoreductase [Kitasatospora sp. GP82]|uniref:SDR family NAD(P)-dependent oxidoreductase n=1 Tax=Kitasatospora sp. GP82 TaxID=3035089 RepID=UPI0024756FD1|nr:SDR family NAD(P)-dependent oxidoreductase [Kitasatospora sp. GP82]MDH6128329.1 deazaflavin-dependent oxidoreductase (nitroreductase family) [Kitasatospora sp. GP82]